MATILVYRQLRPKRPQSCREFDCGGLDRSDVSRTVAIVEVSKLLGFGAQLERTILCVNIPMRTYSLEKRCVHVSTKP